MNEWSAIEEVCKRCGLGKDEEYKRKLAYAVSFIEHGMKLLKKLEEESK